MYNKDMKKTIAILGILITLTGCSNEVSSKNDENVIEVIKDVQENANNQANYFKAEFVWKEAQANTAFQGGDPNSPSVEEIFLASESAGYSYDKVSGKLTMDEGNVFFICQTGPQETPC